MPLQLKEALSPRYSKRFCFFEYTRWILFLSVSAKLKMLRVTPRKCECNVSCRVHFALALQKRRDVVWHFVDAASLHLRGELGISSFRAFVSQSREYCHNYHAFVVAPTASSIRSSWILLETKKKFNTRPGIHWNIGLRFRVCTTRNEGAFVITSRTHPRPSPPFPSGGSKEEESS